VFELVERAVLGEDSAGGNEAAGCTAENASARPEPGRSRELGLVLHADTFFGQGPAAGDPGEVRGFGVPVPVGAGIARSQAIRAVKAGTSTCVLLAGPDGALQRLVRVGAAPDTGWTPGTLNEAVRRALARDAAKGGGSAGAVLATDRYTPTTAIADHVRAYYPTCTSPTCNRSARACDVDHDEPWPRGPTATTNLNPRADAATAGRRWGCGDPVWTPTCPSPGPPAPPRSPSRPNRCPGTATPRVTTLRTGVRADPAHQRPELRGRGAALVNDIPTAQ